MVSYWKLPFYFDPDRLRADVDRILPGEWIPHFNANYYEGEWSGVALRSAGGSEAQLYSDPSSKAGYADTAVLARCPNLQEALGAFQCPLTSVRLLKLKAGSSVREHRDHELSVEDGAVRVHIPVATNLGVDFYLEGKRLEMKEGECWYVNFNLPHRVENRGTTDRIHLVIDCLVNDWLRRLFPQNGDPLVGRQDASHSRDAAEQERKAHGFERFRDLVLQDIQLQEQLRETLDRKAFIAMTVELGLEHGCAFTAGDVESALAAGRRTWLERRLVSQ